MGQDWWSCIKLKVLCAGECREGRRWNKRRKPYVYTTVVWNMTINQWTRKIMTKTVNILMLNKAYLGSESWGLYVCKTHISLFWKFLIQSELNHILSSSKHSREPEHMHLELPPYQESGKTGTKGLSVSCKISAISLSKSHN